MSFCSAKKHLEQYGLSDRIRLFEASTATAELAALAVGCPTEQIVKTMSFLLPEGPILILIPGDAKISNAKYRSQFHAKAKMIPPDQVESLIGHEVGGVCPFGIPENIPVWLDEGLRRFDVVYPAAGTDHSAVELSPAELEMASRARGWVDVCQGPQSGI